MNIRIANGKFSCNCQGTICTSSIDDKELRQLEWKALPQYGIEALRKVNLFIEGGNNDGNFGLEHKKRQFLLPLEHYTYSADDELEI